MDVVCPRCQSHHRIDPPGSGRTTRHLRVRCSTCGHTFPVAETGVPDPAPAPERIPVAWVRVDGEIFAVPDLATLQRWVLEKRVLPDDRCSADGTAWSAIGDRPELGLFFEAADRLDRSSTSAQHALMTMAHSDAEDVFADPAPQDDGDITELPGGPSADGEDEEPIPAGDEADDLPGEVDDGSARTVTSLSFSADHTDFPGVFARDATPAPDAATQLRPAGGGSGSGTASVRIAAPALLEAVQDAPAAQAFAIAEAAHERAVQAAAASEAAATVPAPSGVGRPPAPLGASPQVPSAPSGPTAASSPSMPDFHQSPPAHPQARASSASAVADRRVQAAAPTTQERRTSAEFPQWAWLLLVVLTAAAVVAALWTRGPTSHPHAAGLIDPPQRSQPLPPGIRPVGLPLPSPPAVVTTQPPSVRTPVLPNAPASPQPGLARSASAAPPAAPNVAAKPAAVAAAPVAAPPTPPSARAAPPAAARVTGRAAAQPGWDAVEHQEWSAATAAFEHALASEPGNPWAAYGRAYVAERTGDIATAQKAYCVAEKYVKSGDLARDIQAGARRVAAQCPP